MRADGMENALTIFTDKCMIGNPDPTGAGTIGFKNGI